jgi:hypothetical protein
MRIAFIFAFLFIGFCSHAQRPELENETLTYSQSKFFNGSSITLTTGTREDSTFEYVFLGTGSTGKSHLASNWKNLTVRVEEVYKKSGKFYAKGDLYNGKKMIGLAGNKVIVDVERAIDNKEILDNAK